MRKLMGYRGPGMDHPLPVETFGLENGEVNVVALRSYDVSEKPGDNGLPALRFRAPLDDMHVLLCMVCGGCDGMHHWLPISRWLRDGKMVETERCKHCGERRQIGAAKAE
jgi:hypothetical protein